VARKKKKRRKIIGVYLLPTLLTLANMVAGFYAIILVIYSVTNPDDPQWVPACWAVMAAMVMDMLDGRIARMTGTTSVFGMQFDSLADLVSFGMAPAILVYARWLTVYPRMGWIMALAFVVGGAMRLARFNVQAAEEDAKGFVGMPITAAGGILIVSTLFYDEMRIHPMLSRWLTDGNLKIALPFVMFGLAYLMFSTVRYPSFKNLNLRRKHPVGVLVLMTLTIYILMMKPVITLFVVGVLYLIMPFLRILFRTQHKMAVEIFSEPEEEG